MKKISTAILLGQLNEKNYYVIDMQTQKWICTTPSKKIAATRASAYANALVLLGKPV